MTGRVINFEAFRAKRPCRRADGSLPDTTRESSPVAASRRPTPQDTRLAKALAAVAAMAARRGAAFEEKVEVFKRVWHEGRGQSAGGR